MRKILLLILLSWCLAANATFISKDSCKVIAGNFFYERTTREPGVKTIANLYRSKIKNGKLSSYHWGYAINWNGGGFTIIQRNNKIDPIQGWSPKGYFVVPDESDTSNPLLKWMDSRGEIVEAADYYTKEYTHQWYRLSQRPQPRLRGLENAIAPLCKSSYNQSPYVNKFCPKDANGNQCVSGCVAAAMTTIMRYWSWPPQGTGSYSYSNNKYGLQSANFGATVYNWAAIPYTNSASDELATIMYHAGVSVAMQYGTIYEGGSGAWVVRPNTSNKTYPCAQNGYVNYFGYEDDMQGILRSKFSTTGWDDTLQASLRKGYPIQYYGYDPNGGGHTFVMDGYDGNGYYHIDWGWGGSGNGYFKVTALSVSGYTFSTNDGALVNIHPKGNINPPAQCPSPLLSISKTTINSATGALQYYSQNTGVIVEYKKSTDTTWRQAAINGTAVSFAELVPASTYNVRWLPKCGSNTGVYSNITFTTPNDCDKPTGLVAAPDSTKAILSWPLVPGEVKCTVNYSFSPIKRGAFEATNRLNYVGTTTSVAPLTPASVNWYRRQADCGVKGKSVWSDTLFYTTKAGNIAPPPSAECITPVGFTVSEVTTTTAKFSWTGNVSDSVILMYRSDAAAAWEQTKVKGVTSIKLYNFLPGTFYQSKIVKLCGAVQSNPSYQYFTTLVDTPKPAPVCNAATGLTVTGITTNAATVKWNEVDSFMFSYKTAASNNWITSFIKANSVQLSALKDTTVYNYQLKKLCPAISSTTLTGNFTTRALPPPPPTCSTPTNLSAVPTSTKCNLSWLGTDSATVQFKAITDANWITVKVTGVSTQLTGLTPSTAYNWQVRKLCPSNQSGYVAGSFTTNSCP